VRRIKKLQQLQKIEARPQPLAGPEISFGDWKE